MGRNSAIVIREAEVTDSKKIVFILKELGCFPDTAEESLIAYETHIAKKIARCKTDESHAVLVAEDSDGEVLGYTAVHWLQYLMAPDTRGYVSELFVLPSARGRGIGRKLLEVVKEQAISRGCSRIMVVNVRNRITYLRSFFLKLGWKERPEAINFILPLEKT